MPNGHGSKEYGSHKYAGHGGTSDCEYHCGCWMGPARSGGPVGLDPFGKCPGNPIDGESLGGNQDYEYVVNDRIDELTSRLSAAEEKLKSIEPGEMELAQKLSETESELQNAKERLKRIREIAQ